METNILKEEYKKLVASDNPQSLVFKFKKLLLKDDENETLEFHFQTLKDRDNTDIYYDMRAFFADRRNKNKVGEFLLQKYKEDITDHRLKADVIQLLGHLRIRKGLKIAIKEIHSEDRDIRYRCIIVLGWLGNSTTLPILNERMQNDPDGQLREYAATAMRQIWFYHQETEIRTQITEFIDQAISLETDEEALTGMIITIQDLYNKKLGIKESTYGETSGNVKKAKDKTILFLTSLR